MRNTQVAIIGILLLTMGSVIAAGCSLISLAGSDKAGQALEATLVTENSQTAPGAGTTFMLMITNRSEEQLTLEFPTSQLYELCIKQGSTVLWSSATDMMFLQVVTTQELAANESISFDIAWDGNNSEGKPLEKGEYTLAAQLMSSNAEVDIENITFKIE